MPSKKLKLYVFCLIIFLLIFHNISTQVSTKPKEDWLYYFILDLEYSGTGYYGEKWLINLNITCTCIESSFFYRSFKAYILMYERPYGYWIKTNTISVYFGDLYPGDVKYKTGSIWTTYDVYNTEDISLEISEDADFEKYPVGTTASPPSSTTVPPPLSNRQIDGSPSDDNNFLGNLFSGLIFFGIGGVVVYRVIKRFRRPKRATYIPPQFDGSTKTQGTSISPKSSRYTYQSQQNITYTPRPINLPQTLICTECRGIAIKTGINRYTCFKCGNSFIIRK